MIQGKTVLLVIDVQHDFIDEGAPVQCVGGKEIVPKIKKLISACRKANIPIIYTREMHRPSRIDMGLEPENLPDHCIIGTKGVEIMDEIMPEKEDIIVNKVRYSAFMGTDLEFVLNGLKVLPYDTLIICGVASNVCVHYTCAEANQRDYRIKVVEDCCAGTSIEEHEAAMYEIRYTQHDALVKLDEILLDINNYLIK